MSNVERETSGKGIDEGTRLVRDKRLAERTARAKECLLFPQFLVDQLKEYITQWETTPKNTSVQTGLEVGLLASKAAIRKASIETV